MECRLKMILWEKEMSQRELAKRVGINENNLSLIVRGKSEPKLKIALRIAKELDLYVEDIWRET